MPNHILDFLQTQLITMIYPLYEIFGSAGARYYWLYIAAGLGIAYWLHRRSNEPQPFTDTFFSFDVWRGPSAQIDYALLLINPLFQSICFAGVTAFILSIPNLMATQLGTLSTTPLPTHYEIAIGTLLTFCLFIADDFARWWSHYLQHRSPFLWAFHKVHHSAEHLNFMTAERFHPLDILFAGSIMTLSVALVNGVFYVTWGNQIHAGTFVGANVIWALTNLAGGVLRHSPFWVSFGAEWERWFISPAMHQIHHSNHPEHYDCNFGGALSVWDRWFGTLYIPSERLALTYGIGEETERYRSLRYTYLQPVVEAWGCVFPAKRP